MYKSTNDTEVQFERIILFNQNDNIRKFCSGYDFVCVLTGNTHSYYLYFFDTIDIYYLYFSDKNKFLTTFNEKVSATIRQPKNSSIVIPPHELRKFQDLQILDIATGLHHILLFAVSKLNASTSLDLTSSDANENIPLKTLSNNDAPLNHIDDKRLKSNSIEEQIKSSESEENPTCTKTILSKQILEEIQSDVQSDSNIVDNTVITNNSKTEEINDLLPVNEIDSKEVAESNNQTIIKEHHEIQENIGQIETVNAHQLETMDKITSGIGNIGDNVVNDVKSFAKAGENKLNDLAKETEKVVTDAPKNVMNYVKTKFDDLLDSDSDDKDDILKANIDESKENAFKELPRQMTESKISNENSSIPLHEMDDLLYHNEDDKVMHNNKLNRGLAEDDSNEHDLDLKDIPSANEVKFIDNGVDVSNTTNILQAMKDEINEMSSDVKNKADELTVKYDDIVNDELNSAKGAISTKIFEIKTGKRFSRFFYCLFRI